MDPPGMVGVLRVLLLLMTICPPVTTAPCPRPCSCPHPVELHCTFRSLIAMPTAVPKHIERMNLGFNSIAKITETSLVGLRKLELFMVHGNEIQSLPDGAFKDLSSLQMLKMSYNKLTEINRRSLQGLWSLARLHLDHNRLEFIHPDAFQGLISLRLLQLEGNRLQQLHPATFTTFTLMDRFHVSTLKHLFLSDNQLTSLPPKLLATMPQLENLYMHGNPWTCDCNMKWFQEWSQTSPGVLKCKKDRALPGGQLCPLCSSPRHLQKKELSGVESLECSRPLISSAHRSTPPEDTESEVLTSEDFNESFGNVSLGLSDEHGNEVELECSVWEPKEPMKISWEQVDSGHLTSNISLSVDLECIVDREKYEQLWRLIAYYSNVPAHLERGIILSKDPHLTYVFRQDSEKDALYYTGVKVNMMAQPEWLMQASVDLQLNRLQSSAKMVKLTLSTSFSEDVEVELVRRQTRSWVMIGSTNTTRKVLSAILGSPSQMDCNVYSSGQPLIQWILPDGSKLEAPYGHPDNRVSVSREGRLLIKAVSHKDAGIYYCMSRIREDSTVLPFHLSVQEVSSPSSGENTSATPIEGFVGNPVSLPCVTSGSPDADITWILPNNKLISFQANSSRAFVYPNGTLHIAQLQPLDSGYYKCVAMNQHGVDVTATKLNVARHKSLIRPLRKFSAQPQSASGVNTQIKVPTGDTEEASGDSDVFQVDTPNKDQDPLRRRIPGVAPGRRLLHPSRNMRRRPPMLRRPALPRVTDRTNPVENRRRVNMSKSKIDPEKWADILAKIRDKNAGITVTPHPERKVTEQTTWSPAEMPFDGVTVQGKKNLDDFTSAHTPAQQPPRKSNEHSRQSQAVRLTSNGYTTENTFDMTSSSKQTHSMHTTIEPHVTQSAYNVQHTNLDPHTSSNGVFFLPQTTSVSLQAVTVWQGHLNTVDSSSTLSLREHHNTNTDVGPAETADGEESDASENSNNDRESFVRENVPLFNLKKSATNREKNEKYLGETATLQLQDIDNEVKLIVASPVAELTKTTASEAPSLTPFRQPSFRRRNGGRKKGHNRRKHKPITPTVPNGPFKTFQPSKPQKTEPFKVTTDTQSTTVPFIYQQVTSSDRLSHKENTVSTATKPSSHKASLEKKDHQRKPLFESASAAPSFPATSPGVSHGNMNSQAAVGISDRAAPEQGFASTPLPPVQTSIETLLRVHFNQHEVKSTSQYPSSGFITTPSTHFIDYLTENVQTTPETLYHNQNQTKSTESVVYWNMEENVESPLETRLPPSTSHSPDPRVAQHLTTSQTSDAQTSLPGTPTIKVIHIQDQQTESLESTRTTDFYPTTVPPEHNPADSTSASVKQDSREDGQTSTSSPTAPVQSKGSTETPLTSSQDGSTRRQLPGRGAIPRGKPRIMKNNFQTFTVKAETDALLPCEAEGEPMPFLSWIKVSSGASIAQNTRVQRFEVHPNGTLIIRSTQLTDRGQYLCMVQNQYGTDKMVVDLVVLSQQPRVLQPRHRDATVHVGGTIDLQCKAEGHPMPRITWVLPNHVHVSAAHAGVPSQQRVSAMTNGSLRISQASYTDRGVYKCIGSSAAGADSVSVRLHVSVLPPVIQQTLNENTTLPQGSGAYLHCTATGAPLPLVRWITPDGGQLAASQLDTGRNLFVFPNGTLYIRELGPANAGRYECLASNAVANSRRTVNLSIRNNPFSAKASITSSSPTKTDVIYGTKVVLNCQARGDPEPRIIWRTPSKKLVDVQYSFDPRIKVFSNGSLTIHSVTDKDSGDYLCVARNKMGDDYVLLKVNVLTRAAKIEQKLQRSSQEVVYGGDLKVDCVASGLPNPEISWALPDGTMVNLDKKKNGINPGRSRRYVVFDNGTLYLNEVGKPEEGDYTCYAENQLGKDEMKVRVKIKVGTFPPQIQDKDSKSVSVFYGETVTLGCDAQGEPVPVITWISPTNRVIAPALDKYQVLNDGTLVVQKVQRFDAGNYTCLARNNAGHDYKVVGLEVLVTSPVINGLQGTTAIKISAVQDQKKMLDCVAKGTPAPRIMWVLPGNVILPAPYYSNRMSVHLNGTLEIRSPKKTDSGQFACIARNEGGEVKMLVDFVVKDSLVRPQAGGSNLNGQSLTVGNAMTLNCSLEGMTLSHITWILPNGTPLLSGARYSKFFHRSDGSLIISNPSVAEVGTYQCLGRHPGGLVERTIKLSPGRKPEISNRYDSPINVMNGENLLLHCQTTGEPLRLAWTLPSGVVLNRPQRAGRYTILPNGTLAITQVSVYDRGTYVCRAANEYGSSSLSVSVIVIAYPPRITSGPPSVTYAKRGVAVQINCVATGIPKVEVAWETPDKMRLAVSTQPRLFGNKYLHPQGSLIIQNPTQRDAGIYRCTARNAIGVDSKATFLNVF